MSGRDRQQLGDEEVLLLVGVVVAPVALGIINPAGVRDSAVSWLLEHHVLVSSGDSVGIAPATVILLISGLTLASILTYRARRERGDGR